MEEREERRRGNHTRIDDDTFNALVDKSVSRALSEMEDRMLNAIGRWFLSKLFYLGTGIIVTLWLEVKGYIKIF